jgi:hypothetical protein
MAQGGMCIPPAPSLIEINGPILAPSKRDGKSGAASEMNTMEQGILTRRPSIAVSSAPQRFD